MSNTYKWYCDNCGYCCEHIISNNPLGKFGAFLLPQERFMFPSQCVRPLYGLGMKGKSRPRPEFIFAYQNVSEPCIWYAKDLRICMIYEKRPLACQEFPLSLQMFGTLLHRECPQVANLIPRGETLRLNQLRGFESEIPAMLKMRLYFTDVYLNNLRKVKIQYSWLYDLTREKWYMPSEQEFWSACHKEIGMVKAT